MHSFVQKLRKFLAAIFYGALLVNSTIHFISVVVETEGGFFVNPDTKEHHLKAS